MKKSYFPKILSITLTAVLVSVFTINCGRDISTSQKEDSKQKIVVWVRSTSAAAVKNAAEKYNNSHSDTEIEVVEHVNEQMADQLSLALTANEAPDIVVIDCTKVPYFASVGAFTDISKNYEALEFKDEFSPGMTLSGQVDGRTYAVPLAPDVSVLLYNKDHYAEVGLDPECPPRTWDELIANSRKLTTDEHYGYVYAGDHAGAYMFTFLPYVWNNGGEFLSDNGQSCELDSENAREALQLFYDLTNTYQVTPPGSVFYSWTEAQDAFLLGKASQIVLGSSAVYNIVNGAGDMNWGACLIPKGPSGTEYASFSGGDSIGITSQCQNVDAAWAFIEYALTDDIQIDVFAKGGLLPARNSQFDNEYFDSTPQYQVLKEALTVGHTPISLRYDEMYDPILTQMQNCLTGKIKPEEALSAIKASIENIVQ